MAADLPLAIDHFRYFAGVVRAQEGSIGEVDHDTVAYHFHEPLGVVGQIIPWNFPLLMAAWKLAPALAAGNCIVLKPAEQTPASIMVWIDLVGDLLPPGVLNIVNGFGLEAGKPLATSRRIAKIAFTGETTTGRLIMQYASENLIPVTLELGGKSPQIVLPDVDIPAAAASIAAGIFFNQGQTCTAGSRLYARGGGVWCLLCWQARGRWGGWRLRPGAQKPLLGPKGILPGWRRPAPPASTVPQAAPSKRR